MSIWVIVIIIVILAVLIFGYLYYGKYSGGVDKIDIMDIKKTIKTQIEDIIESCSDNINNEKAAVIVQIYNICDRVTSSFKDDQIKEIEKIINEYIKQIDFKTKLNKQQYKNISERLDKINKIYTTESTSKGGLKAIKVFKYFLSTYLDKGYNKFENVIDVQPEPCEDEMLEIISLYDRSLNSEFNSEQCKDLLSEIFEITFSHKYTDDDECKKNIDLGFAYNIQNIIIKYISTSNYDKKLLKLMLKHRYLEICNSGKIDIFKEHVISFGKTEIEQNKKMIEIVIKNSNCEVKTNMELALRDVTDVPYSYTLTDNENAIISRYIKTDDNCNFIDGVGNVNDRIRKYLRNDDDAYLHIENHVFTDYQKQVIINLIDTLKKEDRNLSDKLLESLSAIYKNIHERYKYCIKMIRYLNADRDDLPDSNTLYYTPYSSDNKTTLPDIFKIPIQFLQFFVTAFNEFDFIKMAHDYYTELNNINNERFNYITNDDKKNCLSKLFHIIFNEIKNNNNNIEFDDDIGRKFKKIYTIENFYKIKDIIISCTDNSFNYCGEEFFDLYRHILYIDNYKQKFYENINTKNTSQKYKLIESIRDDCEAGNLAKTIEYIKILIGGGGDLYNNIIYEKCTNCVKNLIKTYYNNINKIIFNDLEEEINNIEKNYNILILKRIITDSIIDDFWKINNIIDINTDETMCLYKINLYGGDIECSVDYNKRIVFDTSELTDYMNSNSLYNVLTKDKSTDIIKYLGTINIKLESGFRQVDPKKLTWQDDNDIINKLLNSHDIYINDNNSKFIYGNKIFAKIYFYLLNKDNNIDLLKKIAKNINIEWFRDRGFNYNIDFINNDVLYNYYDEGTLRSNYGWEILDKYKSTCMITIKDYNDKNININMTTETYKQLLYSKIQSYKNDTGISDDDTIKSGIDSVLDDNDINIFRYTEDLLYFNLYNNCPIKNIIDVNLAKITKSINKAYYEFMIENISTIQYMINKKIIKEADNLDNSNYGNNFHCEKNIIDKDETQIKDTSLVINNNNYGDRFKQYLQKLKKIEKDNDYHSRIMSGDHGIMQIFRKTDINSMSPEARKEYDKFHYMLQCVVDTLFTDKDDLYPSYLEDFAKITEDLEKFCLLLDKYQNMYIDRMGIFRRPGGEELAIANFDKFNSIGKIGNYFNKDDTGKFYEEYLKFANHYENIKQKYYINEEKEQEQAQAAKIESNKRYEKALAEEQAKIAKDLTDKFVKSVTAQDIDAAIAKFKIPTGVKVYALRGVETLKSEDAPKGKFDSVTEVSNFVAQSFKEIFSESDQNSETQTSIMYVQVNDLKDLSSLNNTTLNIKSDIPVIYVAGYTGELNKAGIMNEIHSKNNKMPFVKESKKLNNSMVRVFAFKKQGNVYVRDVANDVYHTDRS